jgi:ubiquinone/menaquinone biosynthesis C-methylase UbiE
MNTTSDLVRLYSDRNRSYVRFIRFVRYPQGIHAYFMTTPLLRSGLRVLDAGCGTGIVTLALREALLRRGLTPGPLQGFDLTPAMLECFRQTLQTGRIEGVEIVQADVLRLEDLPAAWNNYDLIVSAAMLEYLARNHLVAGLRGLRALLNQEGSFLLFITRRNGLTRPLIGRWWQSNLYTASELKGAFRQAGFSSIAFRSFPPLFRHLALWGYIIEAHG